MAAATEARNTAAAEMSAVVSPPSQDRPAPEKVITDADRNTIFDICHDVRAYSPGGFANKRATFAYGRNQIPNIACIHPARRAGIAEKHYRRCPE
jgi:hypothetical protein